MYNMYLWYIYFQRNDVKFFLYRLLEIELYKLVQFSITLVNGSNKIF